MAPLIEIHCMCGRVLKIPRWRMGQKGKCTHCQRTVVVPSLYQEYLDKRQAERNLAESAVKQCPFCKQDNPVSATQCMWCDNSFTREAKAAKTSRPPLSSRVKVAMLLSVLIIGIGGVGGLFLWTNYHPFIVAFTDKLFAMFTPVAPLSWDNTPGRWYSLLLAHTEKLDKILPTAIAKAASDRIISRYLIGINTTIDEIKEYKTKLVEVTKQIDQIHTKGKNVHTWLEKAEKNSELNKDEQLQLLANFVRSKGCIELPFKEADKEWETTLSGHITKLEKEAAANKVTRPTVQQLSRQLQKIHDLYRNQKERLEALVALYHKTP